MAALQLRPFEEGDRQAVIRLWRACDLVKPQNDPGKDIDRKLQVDRDLFLVGLLGDELVASVMGGYEGHRGWVNYLAVDPAHREQGLGRQLMVAIETMLHERGCPKVNLQVRESNHEAVAFYESIGYGDDRVIGLGKRLEQDD